MNAASRDRTQGDFDVSPVPLDIMHPYTDLAAAYSH
jgi:hypothetical protein